MWSNFPRVRTIAAGLRNNVLLSLLPDDAPLDLRILGRTLLHAALVGAAAGLLGALFFGALELVQRLLLEQLAGYVPLRAFGEHMVAEAPPHHFRPYLLLLLPALGGLGSGLLSTRLAPETQGGGGNATIEAFHHRGGQIRRRVIWVKMLASILTLGTGGSGGREGPTMHIGGAIGATVARLLRLSVRERRVLLVAGVAAGIAAVFRTPLGAALLATEFLYRDDFESDALIPAVLASVVSYSVVTSIYGETTLLTHSPHYPFVPLHLPLYALLALLVSVLAALFESALRGVRAAVQRLPGPTFLRPALGGLLLGMFATPLVFFFGHHLGTPGQGLGLFGGGYGAAQLAITGASWLPAGWFGVGLLLLLCAGKLLATALTIGSGGSAGDFAPSLVLGGLLGGAFGRALVLLLHDPRIDPGAFALVGMGAFYGGLAHVPLSALILVCELAGSYDLLVPLMLAEAVAFVALRKLTLYPAQVIAKRDSPAHSGEHLDELRKTLVSQVMQHRASYTSFRVDTPASRILSQISATDGEELYPVLDASGALAGIISPDSILIVATQRDTESLTIAVDLMQPAASVRVTDDLRLASQLMLKYRLRVLPVVDASGQLVGFLNEHDVAKVYLAETGQDDAP